MEDTRIDPVIQPDAPPVAPPSVDTKPQKFCKHCGEKIDVECVVCPKCGKQVEQLKQDAPAPQVVINNSNTSTNTNVNKNTNVAGGGVDHYPYKSKVTAAILCFFLGVLGIHRFYVGKGGTGLIWLVTCGIGGIGALVDFIMILTGGFRDKAGMPLK